MQPRVVLIGAWCSTLTSSLMSSFLTQRGAQNSLSTAMEKAIYRIRRGSLLRNPENLTPPPNQHGHHLSPHAGRKERIPSYINQPDITGKAARSVRHILDVPELLLFRDRVLFDPSFLPNQRHPRGLSIPPLACPCLIHIFYPFPRKFVFNYTTRPHTSLSSKSSGSS